MQKITHYILTVLLVILILIVSGVATWWVADYFSVSPLTVLRYEFSVSKYSISLFDIVNFIVIITVAIRMSQFLSGLFASQLLKFKHIHTSTRTLILKTIQILTYSIIALIGFDFLGIDFTALTVVAGALSVGIGFGLQKITSNFISGIILLVEQSIETGDVLEFDNSEFGTVKKLGGRYILVEMFDGKEVMIPNEDLITQRVTNWTFSNPTGRVEVNVGVSYGSDIHLVRKLMLEAASEYENVLKKPEPACFLTEFGDSSVNFILYFFIKDVSRGRYEPRSTVMFSIWDKLKANGIEIPFPQRDIHIKSGLIK